MWSLDFLLYFGNLLSETSLQQACCCASCKGLFKLSISFHYAERWTGAFTIFFYFTSFHYCLLNWNWRKEMNALSKSINAGHNGIEVSSTDRRSGMKPLFMKNSYRQRRSLMLTCSLARLHRIFLSSFRFLIIFHAKGITQEDSVRHTWHIYVFLWTLNTFLWECSFCFVE